MKKHAKTLADFLPLAIFFIAYKKTDIIFATGCLVVSSIVALIALWFVSKKIAWTPLISSVILSIFGGLTWYFNDPIFIKLKPTILNIIFALILLAGNFYKKPLLKKLFAGQLELQEKAWFGLSLRFALFFLTLAVVNEVIWRNYSEDFWVNFKVFGILPISLIFTLSQTPYMLRNQIQTTK